MRPQLSCHMITSIDGRLRPSRWTPLSPPDDSAIGRIYEGVAGQLGADGWIVGRKTMAEMLEKPATAAPSPTENPSAREPFVGRRDGKSLAIVLDPSGKLNYSQNALGDEHLLTILGEHVSDDYLAELRRLGVSYAFAGSHGDDLPAAMATLSDVFGARHLLLEGGGIINGAFLRAGLIDEFSVVIYPGIDGLAGTPSIVDYQGLPEDQPAKGQALKLTHCEMLEQGFVWLRYRVSHAAS